MKMAATRGAAAATAPRQPLPKKAAPQKTAPAPAKTAPAPSKTVPKKIAGGKKVGNVGRPKKN